MSFKLDNDIWGRKGSEREVQRIIPERRRRRAEEATFTIVRMNDTARGGAAICGT